MRNKINAVFTMAKLIIRALLAGNFRMLKIFGHLIFAFLIKGALMKQNYKFGCPNVTRKVTVKEAEEEFLRDVGPLLQPSLKEVQPGTGLLIPELSAMMTEGDELWEYNSPSEDWENLCGPKGFILVRHGKKIKLMDT